LLEGLRGAVPFNVHLGLEYREIEPGRCVVALPDDERLRNHLGSQHGSGLFAAGEAATGGAFTAAFADQLGELHPLITGAEIEYTKLPRGEIVVEAKLSEPVEAIQGRLEAEGVARFEAEAVMRNTAKEEVARMTAGWRLKRPRPDSKP
jgi:acyl-coenzyme A thioesterase PaaI-like protein